MNNPKTKDTNMKLLCSRCDYWTWAARPGLPDTWTKDDAGRPVCAACTAPEEQECDGCDDVHRPPMCEGHGDRYAIRKHVLREAERLTCGDRNASYGDPRQDFQRTAGIMTALLEHKLVPGHEIEAVDVARLLIAVKLSRSVHSGKKVDHYVDMAGYAACLAHCALSAEDLPK